MASGGLAALLSMHARDVAQAIGPRRLTLWIAPLAFAFALLGGFLWLALQDRAVRDDGMRGQSAAVTYFAAQDVRAAFTQYDRTLRSIVEQLEARGAEAMVLDGTAVRELKLASTLGETITFAAIVDHEGAVLARDSGLPRPGQRPHADQRDFFQALRADPDRGLVIGAPFHASNSNSTVIGVARSYRQPGRRFGGVVVLMVEPRRFHFFTNLPSLADGGSIAILRRDGVPLFVAPTTQNGQAVTQPTARDGRGGAALVADDPALRTLLARDAFGEYSVTDPASGELRLVHVRPAEGVPLVVAYAHPTTAVEVDWQRTWMRNGLLVVLGVLGLVTLGLILHARAARAEARVETERARAMSALLEAKDTAEKANRAKSDFLALVTHELRTPLNAIIGFSQILRDGADTRSAQEISGFAGEIQQAGSHLLSLISDLLDLHKIEAGKMEIHPEPIDAARLLRSVAAQSLSLASQRGLQLHTEVPSDLPVLWADPRAARQMLFNLVGNACKFTPEGGEVTVSAGLSPTGGVMLRIADTGIGMCEESVGRALEPFGQIDNDANRRERGTGLGLPLVRGLIALHGGRMTIDSAPDRGTIVSLHFQPLGTGRPAPAVAPAEASPVAQPLGTL